jgi:hypothetical protein
VSYKLGKSEGEVMSYKLCKASTEELYNFGEEAMNELYEFGEFEQEYLRLRSIGSRLTALGREVTLRYKAGG